MVSVVAREVGRHPRGYTRIDVLIALFQLGSRLQRVRGINCLGDQHPERLGMCIPKHTGWPQEVSLN